MFKLQNWAQHNLIKPDSNGYAHLITYFQSTTKTAPLPPSKGFFTGSEVI